MLYKGWRSKWKIALGWACLLLVICSSPNLSAKKVIANFNKKGFQYGYLAWKPLNKVQTKGEKAVRITGSDKGGAGTNFKPVMDISGMSKLGIRLKKGDQATSKHLNIKLLGASKKQKQFTIKMKDIPSTEFKDFEFDLFEGESADMPQIKGFQVQGSFTKDATIDIFIDRIYFVPSAVETPATTSQTSTPDTTTSTPSEPVSTAPAPPVSSGDIKSAPAKGKAWEPAHGFYAKYPKGWIGQHKKLKKRSEKGGVRALFLGDGFSRSWKNEGKKIWKNNYGPLKAANYGIGGDSTRQLLWRLEHGELSGIYPKVIVLMIGTNNLYNDANSSTDDEVVRGVSAVLDSLRKKVPDSKVLLMGILPRENKYLNKRISNINKQLAGLDDEYKVRFLDISNRFLQADGKQNKMLFKSNRFHLNEAGYAAWSEEITPLFEEMMQ